MNTLRQVDAKREETKLDVRGKFRLLLHVSMHSRDEKNWVVERRETFEDFVADESKFNFFKKDLILKFVKNFVWFMEN